MAFQRMKYPEQETELQVILSKFLEKYLTPLDLRKLENEDWKDMKVPRGIVMRLCREVKEWSRYETRRREEDPSSEVSNNDNEDGDEDSDEERASNTDESDGSDGSADELVE